MAKGKKTEFQKESEALESSPAKQSGPSEAMIALFQNRAANPLLDNLERKNLPPMIKAVEKTETGTRENVPIGGTVSGIIVDVVKSPVSTIKGSLLWLHAVKPNGNKWEPTGFEFTFPATGVIRSALAPGVDGEENARRKMAELKGHLLVAIRMPDKLNSKYGKNMGMWDVRISPKALDLGVKIN